MGSPTADNVLQHINKKYVSLQCDDKKYYNSHYSKVLEKLIDLMKYKDSLFNVLYERLYYAGSYYDGLKIGEPDEYDVDVVLDLPINYDDVTFRSKKVTPGFTKIRITDIEDLESDPKWNDVYKCGYRHLSLNSCHNMNRRKPNSRVGQAYEPASSNSADKFFMLGPVTARERRARAFETRADYLHDLNDAIFLMRFQEYLVERNMESWTDQDGFLLQGEIRNWMMCVVDKALESLPTQRGNPVLDVNGVSYKVLRRANGPAITLNVTMPCGQSFDVDLVPVMEFKYPEHWPPQVRKNPFPDKESWFIVPKSNSKKQHETRDTFWRLAFHEQEREIIRDMGQLKPVCRLIKKLRDTLGLEKICSYYIKTVILWEVDKKNTSNDAQYWKTESISNQFMHVLKQLQRCLSQTKIEYYWNVENNLLSGTGMTDVELANISFDLKKIINNLERNVTKNPTVFAKHILNKEEFDVFMKEYWNVEFPNAAIKNITKRQQNDCRLESMIKTLHEELEVQKALFQLQMENQKTMSFQIQTLEDAVKVLTNQNETFEEELEKKQRGMGFLFSSVRRYM